MNDSVAYLRSRWTPELTAAAILFLQTGQPDEALPTLELEGKRYWDLRGILIEQTQIDAAAIQNVNLRWSRFCDVGFKGTHLTQCDLSQSVFSQCYFRRAVFEKCNIVNSRFEDSDFSNAHIEACRLDFTAFKECEISLQTIHFDTATNPQVLARICRNLRINADSMGHRADAARLNYMEKTHERRALYNHAFRQKNESLGKHGKACAKWLASLFFAGLWGYGEKPQRLMLAMVFSILFFGLLQYSLNALPGNGFWEHVYFSGTTFLTVGYGDFVPTTPLTRGLAVFEAAMGVMLLGMLIASWTKKITFI